MPVRARRRAFTLMELLVVIGIISLLVSLLAGHLGRVHRQARTVVGQSNLRQIGQAVAAYAKNHSGMFPVGYVRKVHDGRWREGDTDWTSLLTGYITTTTTTYIDRGGIKVPAIFQDPNASLADGQVHFTAHPVLIPDLSPESPMKRTYQSARLTDPAGKLMIFDGAQDPSHDNNSHATAVRLDLGRALRKPYYNLRDTDNLELIDPGLNEDSEEGAGNIRWRQGNDESANILYADYHIAETRPSEVRRHNIRPDK